LENAVFATNLACAAATLESNTAMHERARMAIFRVEKSFRSMGLSFGQLGCGAIFPSRAIFPLLSDGVVWAWFG